VAGRYQYHPFVAEILVHFEGRNMSVILWVFSKTFSVMLDFPFLLTFFIILIDIGG
jgi:hypothetical protein